MGALVQQHGDNQFEQANGGYQYMGSDGRIHPLDMQVTVIHELIHAIYGDLDLVDPGTGEPIFSNEPRDYNNPSFDFVGQTQRLTNTIMQEMGYGFTRVAYDAGITPLNKNYINTDI